MDSVTELVSAARAVTTTKRTTRVTVKHKQTVELSHPIHFGDVEQFVQMGKDLGVKPGDEVEVRIFAVHGGSYRANLSVGTVNGA
ncbi:hypothetical protein SEA_WIGGLEWIGGLE_72 [Mycobacterium phage Wigglewiggle]|nr:hypothetical protein SEA_WIGGLEWIGGLE_72 [Mycobacterium phage Wigglewiggle]